MKQDVLKRMQKYALGHCPFTGPTVWEHVEFEITPVPYLQPAHGFEEIWYVRVSLLAIQHAYGIFVTVWEDDTVGGILNADQTQQVFEYHPSQTLAVQRTWGANVRTNCTAISCQIQSEQLLP